MSSSLLALIFFPLMALFLKSICILPKLILNTHFCLSFERPINIEVATFSPFCTNLIGNTIHVAMKAFFFCMWLVILLFAWDGLESQLFIILLVYYFTSRPSISKGEGCVPSMICIPYIKTILFWEVDDFGRSKEMTVFLSTVLPGLNILCVLQT